MKILVACERVDAEGGTETYVRDLVSALTLRGHEVRAIARSVTQPDAYGVPAQAIGWSDEHDPPDPSAARRALEIAADFKPDVAALHNVLDSGVIEALRANAPRSVYHLHDHRPFCPNGDRLYPRTGRVCGVPMSATACGWHSLVDGCAYGPRPRTLALIARRERVSRAVAACDATIALSQYVGALAARNGVPAPRLRVIPPPLPPASFPASPAPRPHRDTVLFAGRIVPSKGARSLVRAIALLPVAGRPDLAIAGDGPDLAAVLAAAQALDVRARALGRLDASALRDAYDGASVVAVPSLWGEPFGLVGIEAMARGRPVAAYDVGAVAEWLPPSAGRRVARGDERGLAAAIADLLAPGTWPAVSASALRWAQSYGASGHVDAIERAYGAPR